MQGLGRGRQPRTFWGADAGGPGPNVASCRGPIPAGAQLQKNPRKVANLPTPPRRKIPTPSPGAGPRAERPPWGGVPGTADRCDRQAGANVVRSSAGFRGVRKKKRVRGCFWVKSAKGGRWTARGVRFPRRWPWCAWRSQTERQDTPPACHRFLPFASWRVQRVHVARRGGGVVLGRRTRPASTPPALACCGSCRGVLWVMDWRAGGLSSNRQSAAGDLRMSRPGR